MAQKITFGGRKREAAWKQKEKEEWEAQKKSEEEAHAVLMELLNEKHPPPKQIDTTNPLLKEMGW